MIWIDFGMENFASVAIRNMPMLLVFVPMNRVLLPRTSTSKRNTSEVRWMPARLPFLWRRGLPHCFLKNFCQVRYHLTVSLRRITDGQSNSQGVSTLSLNCAYVWSIGAQVPGSSKLAI